MRIQAFILFLSLLTLSTKAGAQQSIGSITGHIHLASPDDAQTLSARAEESTTETVIESAEIDTSGTFALRNLPFATYDIYILDRNQIVYARRVILNSSVPVELTIDSLGSEGREVTVTDTHIETTQPTVHTLFTAPVIQSLPVTNPTKAIEAVLMNSPGVVPDEDGRLHMRGEDAELQYVIDGIPLTTNQTRIYAPLFDAHFIESADLLRGSLNPEYGVATSGILNITTRSGYDAPSFGHAEYSLGTFNTHYENVDFGGHFTDAFALYGAYGNFSSDRYLDPVSGFDPNHTAGSGNDYFGKINIIASDRLDINALGYYASTHYEVPNQLTTSQQDQAHDLTSYVFGARANYTLNPSATLSLLGYTRRQEDDITSNGIDRIGAPSDTATALKSEKYFIGGHRKDVESGGQLEYSTRTEWLNSENQFKAGLGLEIYPISEFLTFAVTDSNVSNPNFPGGDDRLQPYDLTRGGHPFVVDTSATGKRYSAYVQDQITSGPWTVEGGVRYDLFDLLDKQGGVSPRLNAIYRASDNLVLRASYNRLIVQAPIEDYLVSSSAAAGQLVAAEQQGVSRIVQSEKEHVGEIGAAYGLSKYLTLDLTGYGKLIDDFIVKVELGSSGVIFPVNLKKGVVAGGDLAINLRDWNRFSGQLAFSTIVSKGQKPSDGSTPFAAGLVLGEEGENYANPWPGEDKFNTEHNQLLTASFHLRYDTPLGIYGVIAGRFDSGLPFDLVDPLTGQGPDATRSRQLLEQRGYSDAVINLLNLNSDTPGSPDKSGGAHAIFDASLGVDLHPFGLPGTVTGTVTNIFNTQYIIKFESSFGGTHFGQPRMFLVQAELTY